MVYSMQNLMRKLPANIIHTTVILRGRSSHQTSYSSFSSFSSKQPPPRVVIHDLENGIKHVQLNRPDKLNSLDMEMFHAIANTAKELRRDKSVRVILLSGKGRAFCTGLDIKSILLPRISSSTTTSTDTTSAGTNDKDRRRFVLLSPTAKIEKLLERPSGYQRDEKEQESCSIIDNIIDDDDDDDNDDDEYFREKVMAMGNLAQDIAYLWRDIPVPVIAVLTGMCYGGGLQLALGADLRYSTRDCRLSIMESKWGLIPDMGASITLRELVRMDVAKELTFTGRVFDGEEAEKLGLVTRCSEDPMVDALDMAKVLVKRSPDSIAGAKMLFQRTWRSSSERECLELESKIQRRLIPSWNQFAASAKNFGVEFLPYGKGQDMSCQHDDDDHDNNKEGVR